MTNIKYLREEEEINTSINVKELILKLQNFSPETKIFYTWEGTVKSISLENIYLAKTGSLYLDAHDGFYKEDYEMKPSGES